MNLIEDSLNTCWIDTTIKDIFIIVCSLIELTKSVSFISFVKFNACD